MTLSRGPSLSPAKPSFEQPSSRTGLSTSSGPAKVSESQTPTNTQPSNIPFAQPEPRAPILPQPPTIPVAQPALQTSPAPASPHTPILQPHPQTPKIPLAVMELEEQVQTVPNPPSSSNVQSERQVFLNPVATTTIKELEEEAKRVPLGATDAGFVSKAFLCIKGKILKVKQEPESVKSKNALILRQAGRRLIDITRSARR